MKKQIIFQKNEDKGEMFTDKNVERKRMIKNHTYNQTRTVVQ